MLFVNPGQTFLYEVRSASEYGYANFSISLPAGVLGLSWAIQVATQVDLPLPGGVYNGFFVASSAWGFQW